MIFLQRMFPAQSMPIAQLTHGGGSQIQVTQGTSQRVREPIRGQYLCHVITLDQSEPGISGKTNTGGFDKRPGNASLLPV